MVHLGSSVLPLMISVSTSMQQDNSPSARKNHACLWTDSLYESWPRQQNVSAKQYELRPLFVSPNCEKFLVFELWIMHDQAEHQGRQCYHCSTITSCQLSCITPKIPVTREGSFQNLLGSKWCLKKTWVAYNEKKLMGSCTVTCEVRNKWLLRTPWTNKLILADNCRNIIDENMKSISLAEVFPCTVDYVTTKSASYIKFHLLIWRTVIYQPLKSNVCNFPPKGITVITVSSHQVHTCMDGVAETIFPTVLLFASHVLWYLYPICD